MSDTPRTDELERVSPFSGYADLYDKVREMERELAASEEARLDNVLALGQATAQLQSMARSLSEGVRWIPVSERLPHPAERVAVYSATDDMADCGIVESEEGQWHCDASLMDVTHWMPLPEAPK